MTGSWSLFIYLRILLRLIFEFDNGFAGNCPATMTNWGLLGRAREMTRFTQSSDVANVEIKYLGCFGNCVCSLGVDLFVHIATIYPRKTAVKGNPAHIDKRVYVPGVLFSSRRVWKNGRASLYGRVNFWF